MTSTTSAGARIPRRETSGSLRFPDASDIADRLHFSPDHGRVWFGDRRMVLMDAEMLLGLRDELVALLGIDAARGLVTRMGYVAGCRDAELAKSLRPDASVFDAFMVGPQIHALKGMAEIELLDFRMDIAAGSLYSDFLFKDSFEDETRRPGQAGRESACWMLVGYSSGYATTFMGKRILVREVECRASGQARCRAIAKPVEEWSDPESDLRYLLPEPAGAARMPVRRRATSRGRPAPATSSVLPSVEGASGAPVGSSTAFSTVMHQINRVAATRATVLLLGESGVGKSLLAREVHDRSPRRERPFMAVNCAAIPEALLESELFGVERGAYTGATSSRAGRFEMADAGTLFLDEIASLSLTAQGKILRVLQSGEFERLGSTRTRRVDVRVIAATNTDLPAAIRDGGFREDLFFRLNVFPISIAPLRDRRDDIPLLVGHFLAHFSRLHGRRLSGLSPRALAALLNYSWPGNVRELENVLERAVILAEEGGQLERSHLFTGRDGADTLELDRRGGLVHQGGENPAGMHAVDEFADTVISHPSLTLSAVEDRMLLAAMSRAQGNVSRAAALLGLTRAQLDYRLKRLRSN